MWLILALACSGGTDPWEVGGDSAGDSASTASDTGAELVGGVEEFGCAPKADDVSADEGDAVTMQFACSGGAEAGSWVLVSGPPGAEFDSATGRLDWQTDLGSAATWEIEVEAVEAGTGVREVGTATVWVADAWDTPGNEPVDPLTYTMEYGLPVIHFDEPRDIDDSHMAEVTVTYKGHAYAASIQYRGAASSYYPKRSYRIDFPPDDEFRDDDQGIPKRRSIVLTSTFDDNAYFRQVMCFEFWNAMNPERAQIEAGFAVAYVNGEYWGLYELTDHVDGEWWEDFGHFEDGNLYKSVDHSANFYATYGGAKSSWHSGWEKKEGVDENDFSDIDELMQFVAESPDRDFDAEIGERMELDDIYDWWALVSFTEADDSGGKNAYLYNDPANPKWHHAPWDFNHSLGQTWQTDREPATYAYDFTSANGLFWRLLESEAYAEEMRDRFRAHMEGPLAPAVFEGMIDGYIERIDASARRDWARWEDDYRSYGGWYWRSNWTSYDEEIQYVRDWLVERHAFVTEWDP